MPTIKFTQIAATINELWALDQYGRLWQYDGKAWECIMHPIEEVDVKAGQHTRTGSLLG